MTAVSAVTAWEALDSRGQPTVACRVTLDDGSAATAIAPAGASTGSFEAKELRDGEQRYDGKGVRRAVQNVQTVLAAAVVGGDVGAVDAALRQADPSTGFGQVGANAVLAVSLAAARAAAATDGVSLARRLIGPDDALPLPMPMVNIVSGGAHAGGLLDVQDFLVIPTGAGSFAEAIEWAGAIRRAAQRLAQQHGFSEAVLVADEGGLGLALDSNRAALDLLTEAIGAAGLQPERQVGIALDVAATELLEENGAGYLLASENRRLTTDELIGELVRWCDNYPIVSIEDGLGEQDWDGWARLTEQLGDRIQLIGDDLFVTDTERLARGIDTGVGNAVLVKVNQNGLLSGSRAVHDQATAAGYRTVVSARSGDTEQSWLADLAVGWRSGQIKVGSTHRSERTAKWNRLLELEAVERTVFCGPWPPGELPPLLR